MLENDEFKLVTHKKRNKKPLTSIKNKSVYENITLDVNKSDTIRRINCARDELKASPYLKHFNDRLIQALHEIGAVKIDKIVCFGIGKLVESKTSKYQFALILSISELFNIKTDSIIINDPILNASDRECIETYNIRTETSNCEAKYSADTELHTLFYLPHCPKQLTNNLLWANWSQKLNKCLILANSFTGLYSSCSDQELNENASFLLKIQNCFTEIQIRNKFEHYNVFNDTSLHCFPLDKLAKCDFNTCTSEPKYKVHDVEYIQA